MEKKLRPKKKASIEKIEAFLIEMRRLADELEDDRWTSETESLITDICKEEEICDYCLTQKSEGDYGDRREIHCSCPWSPKIIRYA